MTEGGCARRIFAAPNISKDDGIHRPIGKKEEAPFRVREVLPQMTIGRRSVADHVVVVAIEALPGSTGKVGDSHGCESVLEGDL